MSSAEDQPAQPSQPEAPVADDDGDDFIDAQFSSAGVITEDVAREIAQDQGGTFDFVNERATQLTGDYSELRPLAEEQNEEEDKEEEEKEEDMGLARAQVEQLAAMQVMSLEREYESTKAKSSAAGSGENDAAISPEQAAAAAYAASLQASGFDPTDESTPSDPAQAKARKLAELKARLAASRAMRAAGGGGGAGGAGGVVFGPREADTMELAPGSLDFPEDYGSLQMKDQERLLALASSATQSSASASADGGKEAASSSSSTAAALPKTVPLVETGSKLKGASASSSLVAAPFDPFGLEKAKHNPSISLPQPKQPPRAVRAVSPLAEDKKRDIAAVMSRIQLKPRPGAGVSMFAEKAVEAALVKGKLAREAFDKETAGKDMEGKKAEEEKS